MSGDYDAERIAKFLHGRRNGKGWVARCPAHDDHSPSLSVASENGKVLVHCFTGCPQEAVIRALRAIGLWPDVPAATLQEKIEYRAAKRDLWRRLVPAQFWQRAFCDFIEDVLRIEKLKLLKPTLEDDFGMIAHYTSLLDRVRHLEDAALAAEHAWWLKTMPQETRFLGKAAQDRQLFEIRSIARYLEGEAI